MATPSPYTRPAPIRCKCVANRTTKKAISFHYERDKKKKSFHLKTVTALSDGTNIYTTARQHHLPCRIQPKRLQKTFSVHHPIPSLEKRQTSLPGGDYLTIQGQVEKVQEARMTKVQEGYVPILDLRLRCGQSVLEVPLWRGEALSDLYVGDEVELTHLKAFLKENGKGKLNSSTYTTIKIAQRKVDTAVVEIVGVSDGTDSLTLLSGNFEEFAVSASLYRGSVEELIENLPVKLEIKHIHKRVIDISLIHS
ncbi:Elongation factor P [Labeo rohita]|uniref:Elongation factor P n=1 Tax=Labeo rohita TaxID=84645 RepID=A0ABQ8M314_LABRO|nr:Elongation factor P [Labeo rohita]